MKQNPYVKNATLDFLIHEEKIYVVSCIDRNEFAEPPKYTRNIKDIQKSLFSLNDIAESKTKYIRRVDIYPAKSIEEVETFMDTIRNSVTINDLPVEFEEPKTLPEEIKNKAIELIEFGKKYGTI